MRVLIDYRPALRGRSGAGEYTHALAAALLDRRGGHGAGDEVAVTLFSSSWKHRLELAPEVRRAGARDLRIPVALLSFSWHRLGWPPVEQLTRLDFDVAHSSHPLIMPARRAARVVTIHDLDFLKHPERTRAEIRRDYPALVHRHARSADAVLVPSRFTSTEVERLLGVDAERITVCSPGAPCWTPRAGPARDGCILFLGTLEPRKNVGHLLDAYERLLAAADGVGGRTSRPLPPLVLAGAHTPAARPWLERMARPPLAGRVTAPGYVDPDARRQLYEGAAVFVMPSFDEGFGLPVLEAMTIGVPVVAADRGALPEVLGGAGLLVDPLDPDAMAAALRQVLDDDALASNMTSRGLVQASGYRWDQTADQVCEAYRRAIARRRASTGAR